MDEEKAKPAWLPLQKAAAAFGLPVSNLEEGMKAGGIEARKVGRTTLLSVVSINTWIEAQPALVPQKKGAKA